MLVIPRLLERRLAGCIQISKYKVVKSDIIPFIDRGIDMDKKELTNKEIEELWSSFSPRVRESLTLLYNLAFEAGYRIARRRRIRQYLASKNSQSSETH